MVEIEKAGPTGQSNSNLIDMNLSKIKIFTLGLVFVSVFGFSHSTSAQGIFPCKVTTVSWGQTQAVVGDDVDLIINVDNIAFCTGKIIEIRIWDWDFPFPYQFFDEKLRELEVPISSVSPLITSFKGSQITVTYTLTQADFDVADEPDLVAAYFDARIRNDQSGYVQSGYLAFYATIAGLNKVAACEDSSGNYSCDPQEKTDCSNAPGCTSTSTCYSISATQCDQPVPKTSFGQPVSVNYSIPKVFSETDDVIGLINLIAGWIFTLAIPVIVIIIIWVGIKFVTSRGNPTEIQKAKTLLWYALIGLAIVLIGRGFVELIFTFLQTS